MNVLVACEESQAVCKAFRALGHNAYSCDLLPCSGGHPEWHIQRDVLDIIDGCSPGSHAWFFTEDCKYHFTPLHWDLIIAFPPCTDLAVSGARWFKLKQADGRQQKSIEFFLRIASANCPYIVIENPIGIMSSIYRKPDQIVHPYWFGDAYSKSTCLWFVGDIPKLVPTNLVTPCAKDKNGFPLDFATRYATLNGKVLTWNDPLTAYFRSKTPSGLAIAMASQWSHLCSSGGV